MKINNFFVAFDLEIWQMTLKNNSAPLLCYFRLCASFHSHQRIHTGVTDQKCPIWVKICDFFLYCVTMKFDGWPWKKRAPFLCYFKLCASLRIHQWIENGVAVRKIPIRVKISDFSSCGPRNLVDDLEQGKSEGFGSHRTYCAPPSWTV